MTTQDRLPPSSFENERGIAGCCLLSPVECVGECVEKNVVDAIYDPRIREMMETMVAMSEQRQPIDTITLGQWLKDNDMLDKIGGHAFMNECMDSVPSAANLSAYIEVVKEKHLARKLLKICGNIELQIYSPDSDIQQLLDESERDILAIRPSDGGEVKKAKELVRSSLDQIETLFSQQGAIGGISTGLSDLDKLTDGLHGGEMIVVSGFEKAGKTALAMGMVQHCLLELKIPVGVFSLEMSGESLMTRMLCSEARVNLRNIRNGFMSESDFPRLTSAAGRLSVAPLFVDDSGDLTAMQFRAKARRLVQQHKVRLIVADYLQLLTAPEVSKKGNREQEVSAVSKAIKAAARELNVPIIVLSQLNDDGRLRESRAIGQDADAVWKLTANEDSDPDAEGMAMTLRVDRNRSGPTGGIQLTFLRNFTRFQLAAKVADGDCPTDR